MGGTCTVKAFKDRKDCIICGGRHPDDVAFWPKCRVARIWMELLEITSTEYKDANIELQRLIFLGLHSNFKAPWVLFKAKCLAYLMHSTHNYIRLRRTPALNLSIGNEANVKDLAKNMLAEAAHGHSCMSKTLEDWGIFGTNNGGNCQHDSRSRKSTKVRRASVPADAPEPHSRRVFRFQQGDIPL